MVVLSANIPHYHYLAEALNREGLLDCYHTSWSLFPGQSPPRWLPAQLRRRLETRRLSGVPRNAVRNHLLPEAMQKLLLAAGGSPSFAHEINNRMFDRRVGKTFGHAKIYHFVNTLGAWSAERARSQGLVVVCDTRQEHPEFQRAVLLKEAQKREVSIVPDLRMERRMIRELSFSHHVIVPSEYCKRTLVAYGCPAEHISILPYGVDLEMFKPVQRRPRAGPTRLLFVGTLSLRKGVLYLLEAMRLLNSRKFELTCIGTVDPSIKRLLQPFKSDFVFIPSMPKVDLVRSYATFDAFILPSLADAFPLVILEAAASGLPVIATDHVGSADWLRKTGGGLIVPSGQTAALADAIEKLSDPDLRMSMSRANIEARGSLHWKHYESNLVSIYRRAILPLAGAA
jgi:glycosyltransferase involved in cell wall biosynthesis